MRTGISHRISDLAINVSAKRVAVFQLMAARFRSLPTFADFSIVNGTGDGTRKSLASFLVFSPLNLFFGEVRRKLARYIAVLRHGFHEGVEHF